jgi:hypothetical protein
VSRFAQIPVTVRELTNQPLPGMYLATRKSDGKYYVKVQYKMRQSRKWMDPKRVQFKESLEGREVFCEKTTELI